MIAIGINQEIGNLNQASNCRIPADPLAVHSHHGTHDTKTGTTYGPGIRSENSLTEIGFIPCFIDIIPVMFRQYSIAPFQGQSAVRMGSMPEKTEGLLLYQLQQLFIIQIFNNAGGCNTVRTIPVFPLGE